MLALGLVALLEEEDRQRDADADENDAQLREGVAVVFEPLLLARIVARGVVMDLLVDEARDDQEDDAEGAEHTDQQMLGAEEFPDFHRRGSAFKPLATTTAPD